MHFGLQKLKLEIYKINMYRFSKVSVLRGGGEEEGGRQGEGEGRKKKKRKADRERHISR